MVTNNNKIVIFLVKVTFCGEVFLLLFLTGCTLVDTVPVPGFAITHDQYLKKFLVKESFQLHYKPRSISGTCFVLLYFRVDPKKEKNKNCIKLAIYDLRELYYSTFQQ